MVVVSFGIKPVPTDKIIGGYAFCLMVAFLWGVPDASVMPRWALIALAPFVMLWMPQGRLTNLHFLGFTALGWAALTMRWGANHYDGVGSLIHLAILGVVFGLGSRVSDMRPVYIGAGLGLWLSSLFVLTEWLGYSLVHPFLMQYAGLFLNPNLLAEVTALVCVGAILNRIWWLLPGLLPSLIMPGSRGALLGLSVALIFAFWRKAPRLIAGAVVLGLAALTVWSFDGGKHISTMQRVLLMQDNVRCLSWFGWGIGSYDTIFPYCAQSIDVLHFRPIHAHSDYFEILIELGIGGILLIAMPVVSIFSSLRIERYVLVAFMAEAAVGFPSYMPATAFMAALAMGHICRDWVAVRDRFHSWRVLFRASVQYARLWNEPSLRPYRRHRLSV